jgi:cytokinesis protein
MILMLGNFMNGRGFRGNAQAMRIHSINRLVETKASDGKTTLLHFLANTIEQKFPELLSFLTEFEHVFDARRGKSDNHAHHMFIRMLTRLSLLVAFAEMNADYSEMKLRIVEIMAELEAHHKPKDQPDDNDIFGIVMSEFVKSAKARFDKLDARFHEMRAAYDKVVTLYGEDPKTMSPHEFFGIFHTFVQTFKKAQQDNYEKMEREERMARRRKAEEERAQELASRRARKEAKEMEIEDKGAMESLLANLRNGTDFDTSKRRRNLRGVGGNADRESSSNKLSAGADPTRRISVSIRTRAMLQQVSTSGGERVSSTRTSTRRRERRKASIADAE